MYSGKKFACKEMQYSKAVQFVIVYPMSQTTEKETSVLVKQTRTHLIPK